MEQHNILLSLMHHAEGLGFDVSNVLSHRITDRQAVLVLETGHKVMIDLSALTITTWITPPASALAEAYNVDVTTIRGSGKAGVILIKDVQEAIKHG